VRGYLDCALWCGIIAPEGIEPGDDYTTRDIDPKSNREAIRECLDFFQANETDLFAVDVRSTSDGSRPFEILGHDFYLSRNGHGTGFWDRGYGDIGDKLHRAAAVYGSASLMLCEDTLQWVG